MMRFLNNIIISCFSTIAFYLFGGFNGVLETLLFFMVLDYITGIVNAGVFKKSAKTKSGSLSSKAGLKGICKKVGMLIVISISYRVDNLLSLDSILLTIVEITLISNEAISILENLKAMGVPIPRKLSDAIESMTKEGD